MTGKNRYEALLEAVFFSHYAAGRAEFEFAREELEQHAADLGIPLPKNLGDLVYSFRYRVPLPERIRATAPVGQAWVILPAGRSRYRFRLEPAAGILPNPMLMETKGALTSADLEAYRTHGSSTD